MSNTNITRDPMIRTAGADFRAIDEDDIASATRGLMLADRTGDKLIWTIKTHAKVDLFASAVIVVAAARMLDQRTVPIDFGAFTVNELNAIRRDPALVMRCNVDAELSRRDRATAED